MRLTEIARDGFIMDLGPGLPALVLDHETVVTLLSGLADPANGEVQDAAGNDQFNLYALTDACQAARRQVAGIAWRQGVCSWSAGWQPIPHDPDCFHEGEEQAG